MRGLVYCLLKEANNINPDLRLVRGHKLNLQMYTLLLPLLYLKTYQYVSLTRMGGLTVACCNIATVNMTMAVG